MTATARLTSRLFCTVNGARVWYPLSSLNGSYKTIQWGSSNSARTPGDYDGNGTTDVAVWQDISPTQKAYYALLNNNPVAPAYTVMLWGAPGDYSVNSYNVR